MVGASVASASERSTSDSVSPSRRTPPKRSFDKPPEERDLATEPADRPRGVERPAAGNGREASVGLDEDVDEGLAGDDDHATHRTGATYAGAMDRLADAVELLDGPLDDPATLAGNLRDLRRINRWLGGVRLSADAIDALAAHRDSLTVLDVGTGGADIPMALLAGRRQRGRGLSVVGIDSRPGGPRGGRDGDTGVAATTDGLELHVGDGRSLPYGDGSFDVVHSSLVIHHLRPARRSLLLREMARVARLGVVVNDLDRSRLGWIGAWLIGHLLTGNRYTRSDAPLSVLRAYRPVETKALLLTAGLTPVRTIRGSFGQRYAIAARRRRPRERGGPGDVR